MKTMAQALNIDLDEVKDYRKGEINNIINIALIKKKYYSVIYDIFKEKPILEQSFSPASLQDDGDFYKRLNSQGFKYGILSCFPPSPSFLKRRKILKEIFLLLELPEKFWEYNYISKKANDLTEFNYIHNYRIDCTKARALLLYKEDSLFIVGKGKLVVYPIDAYRNEYDEEYNINNKISLSQLIFLLSKGYKIVAQDTYDMLH